MKLKYLIFLIILFFLTGCTATHPLYLTKDPAKAYVMDIKEFNQKMKKTHFTVVMNDGGRFPAYNVQLGADSTSFSAGNNSSQISVPTQDIHSFEDKNHILGGLQGIFLGTLGGFVVIGGTAYLIDPPSGPYDFAIAIYSIGGGIIGGAGGLIFGTIKGSTDVYEIKLSSEK